MLLKTRRRALAPIQTIEEERHAKRAKRTAETAVIGDAVTDLLKLRAANGGVAKQGDIQCIINKYKKINCNFVTRSTIDYAIKNKKIIPPVVIAGACTNISPLTEPIITGVTEDTPPVTAIEKALIKYHKEKEDSPMKTKVDELKSQWARRKHRMFLYDGPDNDSAAAGATIESGAALSLFCEALDTLSVP
jgi:hypothetical protein